jgi:hypothetical protein
MTAALNQQEKNEHVQDFFCTETISLRLVFRQKNNLIRACKHFCINFIASIGYRSVGVSIEKFAGLIRPQAGSICNFYFF